MSKYDTIGSDTWYGACGLQEIKQRITRKPLSLSRLSSLVGVCGAALFLPKIVSILTTIE
jgi:hypothetical protein